MKIKSDLVFRALKYAENAHRGQQQRKYDMGSYIQHPIAVAGMMINLQQTESGVAAALLHDVIEDCGKTAQEIEIQFTPYVARLVEGMTDTDKNGNRATRKRRYADKIGAIEDPELHTLKVCDLIDNAPSIITYDPGFAKVFIAEITYLLTKLTLADQRAVKILTKIIREGK